jgi:hypothetical protein
MAGRAKEMIGRVYGRLRVVARSGSRRSRSGRSSQALWLCVCTCGQRRIVPGATLRASVQVSCGCWRNEMAAKTGALSDHSTHGDCIGGRSPEYRAWSGMIARCEGNDPSNKGYRDRGISVCSAWRGSFPAFLRDVGRKPSPEHSLDRIDNDGNYEPGNCRWATRSEQASNRRIRGSSGIKGVFRDGSLWRAMIHDGDGAVYVRGRFATPSEAAAALFDALRSRSCPTA